MFQQNLTNTLLYLDAKWFFKQLSSLVVKCNALELHPTTPAMFELASNVFEGQIIPELIFKLDDYEQSESVSISVCVNFFISSKIIFRNSLLHLVNQFHSTALRVEFDEWISRKL